jgi:hypothetical protein
VLHGKRIYDKQIRQAIIQLRKEGHQVGTLALCCASRPCGCCKLAYWFKHTAATLRLQHLPSCMVGICSTCPAIRLASAAPAQL